MTRIVIGTAAAALVGLGLLWIAVAPGAHAQAQAQAQASEEAPAPPAVGEETEGEREVAERPPEAPAEPPPAGASGDQFTPTERLRHDQEVDFPVDI